MMKRYILIAISSLLISMGSLFAQEFPTIGEVYDYEIGDVFHIVELHKIQGSSSEDYWDSTIKVLEVTNKVYSVDYDTVCYQVFLMSKQFSIENPNPVFNDTYYDLYYTNLEQEFLGDTLLQDFDYYNGREYIENRSISYNGYGPVTEIYHWVIGCGLAYDLDSEEGSGFMESYSKRLVYFRKGDEEWGEELMLVGIVEDIESNNFVIYPNPVQNQLHISTEIIGQKPSLIDIYNSTGQMVKSLSVSSSHLNIDMTPFSKGFYYVNLVDENGIALAKQKVLKI